MYAALTRTAQSLKRRDRFCCCGAQLALARRGDELVLSSYTCMDRLCEPCQEARRQCLLRRTEAKFNACDGNARFFTFTMRHTRAPLLDQIKRLRHSLRLLHQRPWWKLHARGGVDAIEFKLARNGSDYHVHAHCIVEGTWIDLEELSRVWLAITGDSSVVDVRGISDGNHAARYVTKYATKPIAEDILLSPAHLDEAVVALRGVRLVSAWGTWQGVDAPDDEEAQADFVRIASIANLVDASNAGDAGARLYLQLAAVKWPRLGDLLPPSCLAPLPPDTPPPDVTTSCIEAISNHPTLPW